MRTKLLIMLPTDGHGGCEYNALTFAKVARDRLGLDVAVAAPQRASTAFVAELVQSNGLAWRPLATGFDRDDDAARFRAQHTETLQLLDDLAPDAVFAALPWPARGAGVVAACADRAVPSLVKFALVPETLYGPPDEIIARLRQAHAGRQLWFANSRQSAGLVERHFGLPEGAVEHFHVGPIGLTDLLPGAGHVPSHGEARIRLRRDFGFPGDAFVVVTVARLSSQKGYETMLAAAEALAGADPSLHFLWVGEGELRPLLEARIRERAVGGRIALAGFRSDVRAILRGSDAFALPTVYEGGCSQALLEAMAEGLPIVVSRTSAVAEVARDGIEALLCPVGDAGALARAIRRLAASPRLRRRLGRAAASRAALFSRDAMFRQTALRLDRLLGSRLADHPTFAAVGTPTRSIGMLQRTLKNLRRSFSVFIRKHR